MGGIVEEVTLNWTDLTGKKTGATSLGSNKFYKAKIVDDGGSFTVHFNWGRVGQSGQNSSTTCSTLAAAQAAMNKKLNSKIKKGYTKVEMRDEDAEKAKAKAAGVDVGGKKKKKKAAKKTKSYNLDAGTKALLKIMYKSTGDAIVKGLSSSAGASSDAPLGNLADSQLDKGADLLDEAEGLLAKKRGKPKHDDWVDLTNEYLSNIPRDIDYARKGGRLDLDQILLNTQERIDEQRKFITLLRDAFLQKEVFEQAAAQDDPTDVWYEGLNCTISAITDKDEFKHVSAFFDRGQSPKNSNFYKKLKVARAWRFERNGEDKGFQAYLDKMQKKKNATGLIRGWHGTRTENLMGISKSGLLMPENLPKGVHVTGKAFGMGIYHAPCWEDAGQERKDDKGKKYTRYNGALKSMNYTSMRGAYYDSGASGKLAYMFLQEIALGTPEVHLTACWNKKRPDKGKDYIYAQAWGNPRLSHDEIVTFVEDAQRITHVLEIAKK
jgi:predicted DNA-binding WGR domain protein